jgi:hypothetical protein
LSNRESPAIPKTTLVDFGCVGPVQLREPAWAGLAAIGE